jgi:hypothetical protein
MRKTTSNAGESVSGKYVSAGKSVDGVTILMPAVRPKNFTLKEIERTVGMVKRKSGRYVARDSANGQVKSPVPQGSRSPASFKR